MSDVQSNQQTAEDLEVAAEELRSASEQLAAASEQAEAAIASAVEAFESWKMVPAPKRAKVFAKFQRILEERKEELAKALTAEFRKGFDALNLSYMGLFYQAFPNCDAVRHELSCKTGTPVKETDRDD